MSTTSCWRWYQQHFPTLLADVTDAVAATSAAAADDAAADGRRRPARVTVVFSPRLPPQAMHRSFATVVETVVPRPLALWPRSVIAMFSLQRRRRSVLAHQLGAGR